ncbi:MAG: hypothetical protein LKI80_06515 [Sporolactobacillus sp.]|jgi:putative ABC transport system permease protein|nr:hypothetical protein [Sporolactobacillus sp.]
MYLAWKEIKYSRGRFFFMTVIVALLAYLVFFVSGLANGLSEDNAAAIERFGHQTFILQKDADRNITRSRLSVNTTGQLRERLGEKRTAALNIYSTSVRRVGQSRKIDLTFFHTSGAVATPTPFSGHKPPRHSTTDLIIDRSVERNGIHLNNRIKGGADKPIFKIVGLARNATFSHMPVAYLNDAQWKKLEATPGQAGYSAVLTTLSVHQAKKLTDSLHLKQEVTIIPTTDVVRALPGYAEEQGSLKMMIAFLLVISIFILGIFFYIITMQKEALFGTLKAIGTGTGYLVRSLVSQTLITLALSLATALAMTELTAGLLPAGMPFSLGSGLIVERLAAFILISLVSILLSVRQIIRLGAQQTMEGE